MPNFEHFRPGLEPVRLGNSSSIKSGELVETNILLIQFKCVHILQHQMLFLFYCHKRKNPATFRVFYRYLLNLNDKRPLRFNKNAKHEMFVWPCQAPLCSRFGLYFSSVAAFQFFIRKKMALSFKN